MGFPNALIIANGTGWSGILMPIVFLLFLNMDGTELLAFRIKVNGPGRERLSSLKTPRSKGLVKLEMWLRSVQINEKLAFSGLMFFKRQILSNAFMLLISQ